MSSYGSPDLSSRRPSAARTVNRELDDLRYESDSGFFASLFDVSFESSIGPKIIRASYILFLVVDAIIALVILIGDWSNFLVRLIFAAITCLVFLVWVRLLCESLMTLHNIEKYTGRLARSRETWDQIERNTRPTSSSSD